MLRSHPSSMPSTPSGKGNNQQRCCAGRLLKELHGRMLVGQQGAQAPQKTRLNTSFPIALTAQPFCVPCPAHRVPWPNTMPLHTTHAHGDFGHRSATFFLGCLGMQVSAEPRAVPLPQGLSSPCTCLTGPCAGQPQLLSHTSRQLSRCSCRLEFPLPSLLFSRFLSSALPYGSS